MNDRLSRARLYGIVDLGYVSPPDLTTVTAALLRGGVDLLQLRAKGHSPDAVEMWGAELLRLTRPAGVPLIVNDFPDVAARLDADGVHVGQEDDAVARARSLVGPGKIVGKSTHSLALATAAIAEGADYIGFGPLFATPTKPGRPAIGLHDVAEVHRLVTRPIFCIGGIKPENLDTVLSAGARRVVIVSALLQAADPEAATRAVKRRLD